MNLPTVSTPALTAGRDNSPDRALAERHRPVLMLDANEPALPLGFGYSVLRETTRSPSSKFTVAPPQGGKVIEYAIWYDWDIEHLYDLEHVWVHLNADGQVVRVEGSMHGLRVSMDSGPGLPELRDGRPVLYVEPGKHALWGVQRPMGLVAGEMIVRTCGPDAGSQGIHTGNHFFEAGQYAVTPRDHRLARLAMKRAAFVPSFEFSRCSDDAAPALLPWAGLADWIPQRIQALIAALPAQVPHLAAVFLDCGDTLIDETTEVKVDGSELVTAAKEIPYAMDAVRTLHERGHTLALVADGLRQSFQNLLEPRGIWSLMQAHAISEEVGELKPSAKMFDAALAALGLGDADRKRIVMVGNNLARDIRGANQADLISLFVAWSRQRSHEPADASEQWDHRIDSLDQLVPAIEAIELSLNAAGGADG